MIKKVRKMLNRFSITSGGGGEQNPLVGYIANLGHGMLPTHSPEHALCFVQTVQEESAKMIAAAPAPN